MKRIVFTALISLAGLSPSLARAGQFGISEMDSTVSGRGYAGTTAADSPSAVFYNPANLSRLEGVQVNLGISALLPQWTYTDADGNETDSEASTSTPPALFASYNLGNVGPGPLAAGIGFYVPYGSNFTWPADWPGRAEVQDIKLQIFELSPALSYRPHEMIAIGAGFRYMPGVVRLTRAVEFGTADSGTVTLAGSGSSFGASAGLSVWPLDGLSVAFVWRSAATFTADGESDFQFEPPFDTAAVDREVEAEVPLAQTLRLGLAYDVLPNALNLAADIEYQMWSEFESLDVTFINADGSRETQSSPRDAHNSWVFHSGAQYKVSDAVVLRAGYIYDQKTLPQRTVNPAPPESNRHVVSVGGSYLFGDFGVHAHFMNVFFAERTTDTASLPGTYSGARPGDTMAYIFGLSVSAKFDVAPVFGAPVATAADEMPDTMPPEEDVTSDNDASTTESMDATETTEG